MWYAIWFTNFSATVAFTVHGITDGRSSSQPTFQNVVTNEGNAFSMTNGTFMAPRKGLFYFIFHLVKKRANPRIDSCSCVLYKNGASTGLVQAERTLAVTALVTVATWSSKRGTQSVLKTAVDRVVSTPSLHSADILLHQCNSAPHVYNVDVLLLRLVISIFYFKRVHVLASNRVVFSLCLHYWHLSPCHTKRRCHSVCTAF